jgi:hypothetical protein
MSDLEVSSEEESDSESNSDEPISLAYEYKPLKLPKSTRVIRLTESRNGEGRVSCTLDEIPLDGSIQYDAVSYTWDGQRPRIPVTCDGRVLLVTHNCSNILRRLSDSKLRNNIPFG